MLLQDVLTKDTQTVLENLLKKLKEKEENSSSPSNN